MVIKVHDLLAEISRLKYSNLELKEAMPIDEINDQDEVSYNSDITLLFRLRDSAKVSPNEEYRFIARGTADKLEHAIRMFFQSPTYENLTFVNSTWAQGHKVVKNRPTNAPSDQGGSLREGARLAA